MTVTPPLTWLHIGDLHIKQPGEQNQRDFQAIVSHTAALPAGGLDFVLLPGDNADDGLPEQYAIVRAGLDRLNLPVYILPGDHDMAPGSLDAFHRALGAPALPHAETVHGQRCLFLDVVSAGTGGPDFRLGERQLDWTEREITAAEAAGQDVALFMHTYPADLREGRGRIIALLAHENVACVDMGHTHYNELANDGGTIFMATRSTGQIEEGPAGFSIACLDAGCVSWRFKSLDQPWPFVLITNPADRRLVTRRSLEADQTLVRVKVMGDQPIAEVTLQADDAAPVPMHPVDGYPTLFEARLDRPADRIVIRARDAAGRTDHDQLDPAPDDYELAKSAADGSDADAIEAWREKGIVGGQLGPNRNGRKW